MAFEEVEFPTGTPDFPFRSQVLEYLNGYAQSVRHLIVFNKKVERIEKQNGKWALHIRNTRDFDGELAVESFDAVAVASGISFIEIALTQGTMTSHTYRSTPALTSFRP
jgi:cation diffusion facilitator CzcD-associated flavoprotein CzcO